MPDARETICLFPPKAEIRYKHDNHSLYASIPFRSAPKTDSVDNIPSIPDRDI
jgi:hypothetical protein